MCWGGERLSRVGGWQWVWGWVWVMKRNEAMKRFWASRRHNDDDDDDGDDEKTTPVNAFKSSCWQRRLRFQAAPHIHSQRRISLFPSCAIEREKTGMLNEFVTSASPTPSNWFLVMYICITDWWYRSLFYIEYNSFQIVWRVIVNANWWTGLLYFFCSSASLDDDDRDKCRGFFSL